jgi:deoxyribodipyrimidine photo-lyase
MRSDVPEVRIQQCNDAPVWADRDFVLYWMIAQRRSKANFALQRAADWARELGKPLLVLEALRCDYRWASDRLHRFVLEGMQDNRDAFAAAGVAYHAYVEPAIGAGKGLLAALGAKAAVVVTDEFPCFFLPSMVRSAAQDLDVRLEQVDGNGLLPLRVADRVFVRAFDFRRFLQKSLAPHLREMPVGDPLRRELPTKAAVPEEVLRRWPMVDDELLSGSVSALARLPIDHDVTAVGTRGGSKQAGVVTKRLLGERLARYEDRNQPDAAAESGLSPYLHFGHIGSHQVFAGVARQEGWNTDRILHNRGGSRGWYGMSEPAEAFLDQLVTWRELGFNYAWQRADIADYSSLPEWAQRTLAEHAEDPREHCYDHDQLEAAATHDEVWNAAQRQLRRTGTIHNYLRMLWGKKVLEWSPRPEDAWRTLVELNNRWALDGRNPNSYSGIGWVFGRYDRPWAPQRPVFGQIRFMSSQNTQRKLRLKAYLDEFSAQPRLLADGIG